MPAVPLRALVERVAEWPKQWLREGRGAEGREQGVAEGREQGLTQGAAVSAGGGALRCRAAARLADLTDRRSGTTGALRALASPCRGCGSRLRARSPLAAADLSST